VFDPRIERHLIADQGEVVIDEVRKHWAAVIVPPVIWWLPALVGAGVILHASWRILEQRMDRFVITNMRVFRVHGILSQRIATMPLARILDISVHKPLIGRIFGYGHFIFESAAQSQGLREIRYVGDPDGRGLTIQRVIQQSGLRGFVADQSPAARVARPPAPPAPPVPPAPPTPTHTAGNAPGGWEWLAGARRREDERLAELRGEQLTEPIPPFDPDRTTTAPIDLPR
jgi:hypothetical protein